MPRSAASLRQQAASAARRFLWEARGAVDWRLRQLSSRLRTLPGFVILGAQKGGTSTLYQALARHPRVAPAFEKEVHYFDHHFQNGLPWYRAHFPLRSAMRGRVLTGEASPYYLFHPHAPRRLAATLPQARLVALLRNPVERAYSHYHHNRRKGREPLSFAEALAREPERLRGERERMADDSSYDSVPYCHYSYVQRGFYLPQIKAYHRFFKRQQLLVLKSEALFENPQATVRRVLSFLGLAPREHGAPPRPYNTGSPAREDMDPGVRERLRRRFAPHNARLYAYLDADFGW